MAMPIPIIDPADRLTQIEIQLFEVRQTPHPADWARKHFKLSSAYASPGDFTPYPWQVEPINAIEQYDTVIICAAVQIGKSLIAEIATAWVIDNLPMNAMLCYSKREVVEEVFDERIMPLIKEVPAIRKYWSGKDVDLTKSKIKLNHMYLRVASAEVPSDIATWSAGFIYADEVSKYRKRRGWNPLESLKRRQEFYLKLERHKAFFNSSPIHEGDCLFMEMYRPGVLNLEPYQRCPHCGTYQVLVDSQIKEKPNDKGEHDHDPERIENFKAAFYECKSCKKVITEQDRIAMAQTVVWAAKNEKIESDGTVKRREKYSAVSFQINRLVDWSFGFHSCLSRFFAAQKAGIEALQTYINEDMAKFFKLDARRITNDFLLSRKRDYHQYIPGEIPNEVLILMAGCDTQDNGFYFVVNGYAAGMKKYLVRSGFIAAPKDEGEQDGISKDPRQIAYEKFMTGIFTTPFVRRDGMKLAIDCGFIDAGGHRQDDVRYICEHTPQFRAYIGAATVDYKRPLIEESSKDDHYMGQAQRLSEEVTRIISSANFFLPLDIQQEYLDQVRNEYIDMQADRFGRKKGVYVKIDPNHYRSCENLCLAAVKIRRIEEMLFDKSTVAAMDEVIKRPTTDSADETETKTDDNTSEYFNSRRY
jgi:phage terminase large subunit GpA-like protein